VHRLFEWNKFEAIRKKDSENLAACEYAHTRARAGRSIDEITRKLIAFSVNIGAVMARAE